MSWQSDKITIEIVGYETQRVLRDSDFASTVRRLAADAGLSAFNVYVNGQAVIPADAPPDFRDAESVIITPADKGA